MAPIFEEEYKKLNKAQKEAVDFIEGPVMVVAGPGTGKTQILALRIGNILKKTDTKADGILCLTFTNSGVRAMRERLRKYIGVEAGKVQISTFHSFGMDILEKNFRVLGLDTPPKLLDEKDGISLVDNILHNHDWQYIRPRSDTARYFSDLKSLISLLKKERLTPEYLKEEIEKEINRLESDPESISSRGASKGQLKKEIESKIESLKRTKEAVDFYEIYEKEKIINNVLDYDDVLENLVKIVEESETVRGEIREEFLYVLIDEHQDSSGVQNEFLQVVWKDQEKPNIFVVGDDRQLIYGFGGASLEYFENFKNTFGKAKLITLIENYRSTQKILDSSHALLESSITPEKLKSNHAENHPLHLVEADYPRDEIIACGHEIKELLSRKRDSIDPNEIALLVPKNKQVRSAMVILKDMGIPVSGGRALDFFDSNEAQSFLRVLRVLAYPEDSSAISISIFDKISKIPPLVAHKFIRGENMRNFSLLDIVEEKNDTLFKKNDPVENWFLKLKSWLDLKNDFSLYSFVQKVGGELLLAEVENHKDLIVRIEVVRTMLHLLLSQIEKNSKLDLKEFLSFMDRIEVYNESVPLALFSKDEGVKILTLHGSKGLEFDYVWIAHMDEKSFSNNKHSGFSLPENIKERVEKEDTEVLKRQLYVAITRAKRFCTISYALNSYTGADQTLSTIVADLGEHFEKTSALETEKKILALDPKSYIGSGVESEENTTLKELVDMVGKDYDDRKVSVSLLNNFFECPWKWYFRNLLQLPEPKAESLEFGNIVHGSIDKILKLEKKPKDDEILNIVREEVVKSNFGDDRKQKEFEKTGYNIVSNWVEKRLGDISKNRKNEESISLKDERYPHLNIYGKIDLIEILKDDVVKVTDFKTGNARKKNEIEKIDEEGRMDSYMRQLAMYSYLLTENKKWKKEVRESVLEFVQEKKETDMFYRTYITDEHINLLVKDIEDYNKLLKSGEWLNRPCHFKSYSKSSSVCEYCKIAEIYK